MREKKRKNDNRKVYVWMLLILSLGIVLLTGMLRERSQASVLKSDPAAIEAFREQQMTPALYEQLQKKAGDDFWEAFTTTMLHGGFFPREVFTESGVYRRYKEKKFICLKKSYMAVWKDVKYFPVPGGGITYENTFGAPRSYGGERSHEGTDLFGKVKLSGYYPIVSMTDGVVEKVGWLPLGGYRLGIRTPAGAYFYYAHFSEYEKDWKKGDVVDAGDILGYMGNTGYGEEGTVGKFPVHLHLGIYIEDQTGKELSVNPYWVLRLAESKSNEKM